MTPQNLRPHLPTNGGHFPMHAQPAPPRRSRLLLWLVFGSAFVTSAVLVLLITLIHAVSTPQYPASTFTTMPVPAATR